LLEETERDPADHGAAIAAHPAERDRDETVEVQQRPVAEVGQHHLARGEARQGADHAGRNGGRQHLRHRIDGETGQDAILGRGQAEQRNQQRQSEHGQAAR